MKHSLLFVFLLIVNISLSQSTTYKRIVIGNADESVSQVLDSLGVDLECGAVYRDDSLQLELDEYTLGQIQDAGISYTSLDR